MGDLPMGNSATVKPRTRRGTSRCVVERFIRRWGFVRLNALLFPLLADFFLDVAIRYKGKFGIGYYGDGNPE